MMETRSDGPIIVASQDMTYPTQAFGRENTKNVSVHRLTKPISNRVQHAS